MSRIDQALIRWERETAGETPASEQTKAGASSALNQYRDEVGVAHDPSTPVAAGETRHVKTRARRQPAAGRVADPVAKVPVDSDTRARLVSAAAPTVSLEQYRRLAAVLHEEQAATQLKTVMITSALPREGKSLTVVNLALTLSESYGRRVLVIDADLRCPTLHTLLGAANDRGLNEALAETGRELPFVQVSDRLSALTAGQPGPNPLAGLSSDRMRELIAECAERFDWVLIDSSPVGVLPDAQVVGRLVGGVIFVIAANSTPAATVERAIAEIGTESIIGAVLNRVEEHRISEAGHYGAYGYGSPGRDREDVTPVR